MEDLVREATAVTANLHTFILTRRSSEHTDQAITLIEAATRLVDSATRLLPPERRDVKDDLRAISAQLRGQVDWLAIQSAL